MTDGYEHVYERRLEGRRRRVVETGERDRRSGLASVPGLRDLVPD
jgi:hypothetical protein